MTLIARVQLGPVFLQKTLEAVPNMVLQFEDFRLVSNEPQLAVWVLGEDFERFEAALTSDPMVTDYRSLSDLQDKRLYRIVFSEKERHKYLFPVVREQDIITLNSTITNDGIHLVARFPSREVVVAFREAAKERDISFHLEQLYYEDSTANDGGTDSRFGITAAQREAILHAWKAGYFDVPRQAKLETIAQELNISTSALSTRLRRGQWNLVQNTLALESTT